MKALATSIELISKHLRSAVENANNVKAQLEDDYIANNTDKNDIVITQDYGVAAMALGKGALDISPRGYIYDNDNIDRLLFERHLSQKNRRAGGKSKGNHKRNKEDDDRLYYNLEVLIEKVKTILN